MVNGGEREGDGGDGDGTRRTQVREEPAAHDRTPCVQRCSQRPRRAAEGGMREAERRVVATGRRA